VTDDLAVLAFLHPAAFDATLETFCIYAGTNLAIGPPSSLHTPSAWFHGAYDTQPLQKGDVIYVLRAPIIHSVVRDCFRASLR
jgi:hypothetical protein